MIMPFAAIMRVACQEITVYNTLNSGLPDNTVRTIAAAENGALWIGTDWGLARWQNNVLTNYNISNAGLPDNSIRSIAVDAQNRVWAGTFIGGLAIIENDTVAAIYNTLNSPLPDDHVRAIAFDTAGAWIGTTGGLAYKRDTAWQVYQTANSILRSDNITSILIDEGHRVWAGTVNGGLVMIDDTVWTLYRNDNSGLSDNTVLDMAADAGNSIWMAQPAGGLTAFNGSIWLNFNTVTSNAPANSYNGVAIIDNVKYLSSIADGLVVYRGGIMWEQYNTAGTAMPQNELLCIEAGDSGCLWIGTLSSGLVKFCEPDTSISIAVPLLAEASVFPVPASYVLNIRLSNISSAMQANIYDVGGRKMTTRKITNADAMEIPLGNLADGIYFLEVAATGNRDIIKFVKASGIR